MTLYRQLLLYASLTIACLCTGLWVGEVQRTRNFLVNQLESHAQDTATSLGLSLTGLTRGVDLPAMESMISALFDRGYYRLIQMRDVENRLLVDRQAEVTIEHVPAWFIRLVPLNPPSASALVMDGWRRAGSVTVESHPGYAYQTLWRAARDQTIGFTLTIAAIALLGSLGLRRLLRPLARVEEQALALCDRQFHKQEQVPRTRELKRVVLAMNRMTDRIRQMFEEQTAVADSLLQRTFQDPLTSVGNRRYLEAQVKAKLEEKKGEAQGVFFLIQLQNIQDVNQEAGYQAGDRLIGETAAIIQQACHDLPEAIISRLGGGDFAVLLPNAGEQTANRVAEDILENIRRLAASTLAVAGQAACCGGVLYDRSTSLGQLLAKADTALGSAVYANSSSAVFLPLDEPDAAEPTAKTEWKALLDGIIDRRAVTLYCQPTVSHRDRTQVVHYEVLSRVTDPAGRLLSAGRFVPMAERLALMPALDRLIIERLFDEAFLPALTPARLAVNVSPCSLADPGFVAWLEPQLVRFHQRGLRLSFEFAEFRTLRHGELIKAFAASAKRHGHGIGIDHFGQGLMHFGYLKSLLPDYVKIDRAITSELRDEQGDSFFFIASLCNVAHSLDIKVIVEGIESEEQWQLLAGMHIDAVQGFHIRQPEPLASVGARSV